MSYQLDISIQTKIRTTDGEIINSFVRNISKLQTLDALAALLIIHLWQKDSVAEYDGFEINEQLLKLVFRLFSFSFEKASYGYEICTLLCKHFQKPSSYTNISVITLKNFPKTLHQINNQKKFEACCRYYRDIAKKLLKSEKMRDTEENRLNYIAHIEHDFLHTLDDCLQKSKGICQ